MKSRRTATLKDFKDMIKVLGKNNNKGFDEIYANYKGIKYKWDLYGNCFSYNNSKWVSVEDPFLKLKKQEEMKELGIINKTLTIASSRMMKLSTTQRFLKRKYKIFISMEALIRRNRQLEISQMI